MIADDTPGESSKAGMALRMITKVPHHLITLRDHARRSAFKQAEFSGQMLDIELAERAVADSLRVLDFSRHGCLVDMWSSECGPCFGHWLELQAVFVR